MAVYLSPVGLSAAQVPNRVSLLAIYKERLCRRVCASATNQPEAFVTYQHGSPILNGTTVFVPIVATVTIVMSIPTMIFSAYGMNLNSKGMPFASSPFGFWIAILIAAVICLIVALIFKKKDMF